MLFVYVTCANKKEAQKIAGALVRTRLVGCVNICPIDSSYWWKGKVAKDKEVALILKTQERKFSKIEKIIKKMHSYKVPCIVGWRIDKVSKEYLKWLKSVTK